MRKALRYSVAAYLACFLGLAPCIQLAHLSTSDHGHSYCEEHQQIEDIPRKPAAYAARAALAGHRTPLATAARGYGPGAHLACLFSNCYALHAPLLTSGQTAVAELADRGVVVDRPRQEVFVTCRLLLSAPKTSPPFVAA